MSKTQTFFTNLEEFEAKKEEHALTPRPTGDRTIITSVLNLLNKLPTQPPACIPPCKYTYDLLALFFFELNIQIPNFTILRKSRPSTSFENVSIPSQSVCLDIGEVSSQGTTFIDNLAQISPSSLGKNIAYQLIGGCCSKHILINEPKSFWVTSLSQALVLEPYPFPKKFELCLKTYDASSTTILSMDSQHKSTILGKQWAIC